MSNKVADGQGIDDDRISLEEIAKDICNSILSHRSSRRALQDALDVLKSKPFLIRYVVSKWKAEALKPIGGTQVILQIAKDELFKEIVLELSSQHIIHFLRDRVLSFASRIEIGTVVAMYSVDQEWLDEAFSILEVEYSTNLTSMVEMQTFSQCLESRKHPMSSTHSQRLQRLLAIKSTSESSDNLLHSVYITSTHMLECLRMLERYQDTFPLAWRMIISKPLEIFRRGNSILMSDIISILWEADSLSACHYKIPRPSNPIGHNLLFEMAKIAQLTWQQLVQAAHACCLSPFQSRYSIPLMALHHTRSSSWMLKLLESILFSREKHEEENDLIPTLVTLEDICTRVCPSNDALESTRYLWDLFHSVGSSTTWLKSVVYHASKFDSITPSCKSQILTYINDVVCSVLTSQGTLISSIHDGYTLRDPCIDISELISSLPIEIWAEVMSSCVEISQNGQWVRILATSKSSLAQVITDVLHHWVMINSLNAFHIALCIASDYQIVEASSVDDFSKFLVQFDQLDVVVQYLHRPRASSLEQRRQVYLMHLLDLCSAYADPSTQETIAAWVGSRNTQLMTSELIFHSNQLINYFLQEMVQSDATLSMTQNLYLLCCNQDNQFESNLSSSMIHASAWQHSFSHDTKYAWVKLWNCVVWWMKGVSSCPLEMYLDPLPSTLSKYLNSTTSVSSLRLEMYIRRYLDGKALPNLLVLTSSMLHAILHQDTSREDYFIVWKKFSKWWLVNATISTLQRTLISIGVERMSILLDISLSWPSLLNHPELCSKIFKSGLHGWSSSFESFLGSILIVNYALVGVLVSCMMHPTIPCTTSLQNFLVEVMIPCSDLVTLPSGTVPFYGLLCQRENGVVHYLFDETIGAWSSGRVCSSNMAYPVLFDFAGWIQMMLHVNEDWEEYGMHCLFHVYLSIQYNNDLTALLEEFLLQVAIFQRGFQSKHVPTWLQVALFNPMYGPSTPGPWICKTLQSIFSKLQSSPSKSPTDMASTIICLFHTLPLHEFIIRSKNFAVWNTVLDDLNSLMCACRSDTIFPYLYVLVAAVYCLHPTPQFLERVVALLNSHKIHIVDLSTISRLVERYFLFEYPMRCRECLDILRRD